VPQYQSKLWDLFSLLAQLEKSSLPCVLIEQLGNESQRPPVLLSDIVRQARVLPMVRNGRGGSVMVRGNSIVMSRRGCRSRSLLRVLLMVILLMHPCRLSLRVILVLVRENVCPLEHLVLSKEPARGLEGCISSGR
jgi:hypothetical protein